MNIKPLSDRVLLKAVEKESITSSGIFLPESATKERPSMYEVVAVWPGKKDTEMSVKPGDKVLSGQYSGDDVKLWEQEYKVVGMDYILAIVD